MPTFTIIAVIEVNEDGSRLPIEVAEDIHQRIREYIDSKVSVRVDSFTTELQEVK